MAHPLFNKTKTKSQVTKKVEIKRKPEKEAAEGHRHPEDEGEWETGVAPWAYDDCGSCEGSGWGTKAGTVCRICSTKANQGGSNKPNPALFDVQISKGGVPQFRYKSRGAVNGSIPERDEVAEPVVKKVKKVKKFEPKAKAKAPETEPDAPAEEVKTDSPNHLIICVGCGPLKADREVRFLSQILMTGPVGKAIAKKLGAEDYSLAPAFERRDLVRSQAGKICKALVGKILVIDDDNVDEREVASAFVDHAGLVIKS